MTSILPPPSTGKDYSSVILPKGKILGFAGVDKNNRRKWLCECHCGKSREVFGTSLCPSSSFSGECGKCSRARMGKIQGARNKTGGPSLHPLYQTWKLMNRRCTVETEPCYPSYGGRGISVCKRWSESFDNFVADMGDRPTSKHTLERINNDGNYSPSNCKWASKKEQARNRRSNSIHKGFGRSQTIAGWAEEIGIDPRAMRRKLIEQKMTVEEVFTKNHPR